MHDGLLPGNRLYVHLSKDAETARNVGQRHGKPIVLQVDTKTMAEDGCKVFLSENGIYLTKKVPPKYLSIIG
jgi:putative RNA 2'-phosphotransferase